MQKPHRRLTGDRLLRARVLTKLERIVRAEAAKAGIAIASAKSTRFHDLEDNTLFSVLRMACRTSLMSDVLDVWDALPYGTWLESLSAKEYRTFDRHISLEMWPSA